MVSLPVVPWIGHAAAVLRGQWGAVAQRAREVQCRREAMSQQARRTGGPMGAGRWPPSRGAPGRAAALP